MIKLVMILNCLPLSSKVEIVTESDNLYILNTIYAGTVFKCPDKVWRNAYVKEMKCVEPENEYKIEVVYRKEDANV